jgi:hypothetical protein
MILYNITINIDTHIEKEWLVWMKETHIPAVLKAGKFVDHKIFRIMAEEPQGTSYSVQFFARNIEDVRRYQMTQEPALQAETMARYGTQQVSFSTLLESVD